jgi:hypothetical protein
MHIFRQEISHQEIIARQSGRTINRVNKEKSKDHTGNYRVTY